MWDSFLGFVWQKGQMKKTRKTMEVILHALIYHIYIILIIIIIIIMIIIIMVIIMVMIMDNLYIYILLYIYTYWHQTSPRFRNPGPS